MSKRHFGLLAMFAVGIFAVTIHGQAQSPRIVIAAGTLLNGKGGVQRNTRVVIQGSTIVAIDPKAGPVDYDLGALTVLPGFIDTHVHITWSFGADGKNAGMFGTTQHDAYAAAANAWATLIGGVTTVQSLGSPTDIPLRDAIARGDLPGPRILTAVNPIFGRGEKTGTPEMIRQHVRTQKQLGADVIKIFAAGGMADKTAVLSQEQLSAACEEAKAVGLRSVVHAYGDAVAMAVRAGCTQIEHGLYATDDDLKSMAARGTYFDPQAGLLLATYMSNKERYLGTQPYTEDTFVLLSKMPDVHLEVFRRALKTPGLKMVFGSDAAAGAHGRNAEELIYRVRDGGQDPMAALVSANSLAAEALGLSNRIGSIEPGRDADIIALDGDPLKDITAVRRVMFVMKGGVVYKEKERAR